MNTLNIHLITGYYNVSFILKTRRIGFLFLAFLSFATFPIITLSAQNDDCVEQLIASWSMDYCNANGSYSEFSPSMHASNLQSFSHFSASTITSSGSHLCVAGVQGYGFSHDIRNSCNWSNSNSDAVYFSVTVSPESGSEAKLSKISFYERAYPTYTNPNSSNNDDDDDDGGDDDDDDGGDDDDDDDGGSSTVDNDPPSKYGIRISVNGTEIYRDISNNTSSSWSLEEFSFGNNPNFTVTTSTTFDFELLGYCRTGGTVGYSLWDIDELKVYGSGCQTILPCPQAPFDGGSLEKSECDNFSLVIESVANPSYFDERMELVWIKSTNPFGCAAAQAELESLDLGGAYNAFIVAGGFSVANPQIEDSSWEFVRDNDSNDNRFNVFGVAEESCYMRCARLEGCKDFLGIAGPILVNETDCIDCDETFDGGSITLSETGSSGYVVIENFAGAIFEGIVEYVWLRTTNPDVDEALEELTNVVVGAIYNVFLDAGGFEGNANPQIPGTSWFFVSDGDDDDLSLNYPDDDDHSCYVRCSRQEGCTNFHGESNVIVHTAPILAPTLGYEICENTLSISGLDAAPHYIMRLYANNFSTIAYQCNSFAGNCNLPINLNLPDNTYILDIMLITNELTLQNRLTEVIELPVSCVAPLVSAGQVTSTNNIEREPAEETPAIEVALEKFQDLSLLTVPNPADTDLRFISKDLEGKSVRLKIYSNVGQLMLDQKYDYVDSNQIQVDVSSFQTGIYFALIQLKGERDITSRFVVKRVHSK